MKTATDFIKAATDKNAEMLDENTALRAPTQAKEYSKKIFQAIKEKSLSSEDLDKLAKDLKGYKVVTAYPPNTSNTIEVEVMKRLKTEAYTRMIVVRHEKAGWKVQDIKKPYVIYMPTFNNQMGGGRGGRRGR